MSLKRKRDEKNCSGEPSQEQQNMENKTVPKTLLDKLKLHNWVTFADLRFLHIYKNLFSENKTLEECAEEIISSMKGQLANMYIWVTTFKFDIIDTNRHLQEIFIKLITSYMFYVLEHKQTTEEVMCYFNGLELYVRLTDSAMKDGIPVFFAGQLRLELVSEFGKIYYKATLREEMRIDETFNLVISDKKSNAPIFLGEGSYGFAFKVMGPDGEWYVVKVFYDEKSAKREWKILSRVSEKHKCLQNGLALMTNRSGYLHHYVVSAYQGQEALSKIKNKRDERISLEDTLSMFLEMANALMIMHDEGIIHGDIKPENIVIGEKDNRKYFFLIDFGIATRVGATIGADSLYTWWFRDINLMLAEMMKKEFNTMISTIVHPITASCEMDYWAFFMTILKTLSYQSCDFIFARMTEEEARELLYRYSTVISLMKKLKRYLKEDRGIDFVQQVYLVLSKDKGQDEFIQVFNRFGLSSGDAIYGEYLAMFKKLSEENPMRELVRNVFKDMVYHDKKVNVLIKELCDLFVEIICDGADFSLLGLFTKSRIDDWLLRLSQIQRKISELNADVFFY
jgi:hypothetical protein